MNEPHLSWVAGTEDQSTSFNTLLAVLKRLSVGVIDIMGRKLGLFRAVYLVSASCMGSFAFAFDTGIISSSNITL